ncbi:phosphomannomutase/phosphoglucomutase [Methanofollis sp. W23]|uniref:phosphoglucosamine mutase n=1 Tax=Methanofollis sp. W23 TaxID=2817849 RepID=UPI001AEAE917|nr:phosphoglucosamine mutase [Methanofollis sp. W23]MBP2144762.1 phosphomannomutase/phosphoglucomutase [Methanofollis sp. W23]
MGVKTRVQKQIFGTNGVRGVVGEAMTPDLVMRIGMALGTMRKGTIAVGRDTRTSGEALTSAVSAGLMAAGCEVVDCGVLPTPALQYLVREHFDGGAMITASHNPPEYNGVKVIEPDGTEMGDEETLKLEEILFSENFTHAPWDHVGSKRSEPDLKEEYIKTIVSHFPPGIGAGMTVVVDPGSGPAAATTPPILARLGCTVHTINAQMDGRFPGRLPEPSPEGLAPLSEMVRETGAAFGVAHDGDADRAVFIDDRGRYIEENQEFALIEDFVCQKGKGLVVTPVSTSLLCEEIAARHDCSVEYTPVGSIYVAREMRTFIARGKEVIFGGEGNGGLIYPEHQFCRDGGMTAATMVGLLHARDHPLSTLVDALPGFEIIKEKVRTQEADAVINALKQKYANENPDCRDGIRINRPDAWALVRPSGTEPMMRVVVEARDKKGCNSLFSEIMEVVRASASDLGNE